MSNVWQVGSDGKAPASAAAGDYVVTGGGVYQVGSDGRGTLVSSLSDYVKSGAAKTGSKAVVTEAYTNLKGILSGNKAPSVVKTVTEKPAAATVGAVDDNGIIYTAPAAASGYDPSEYASAGSVISSKKIGDYIGYVVLGLIGIAVLDRFIGGGGRKK